MELFNKKAWVVMSLDEKFIVKGNPRRRYLRIVDDKSVRMQLKKSQERLENGLYLDGVYIDANMRDYYLSSILFDEKHSLDALMYKSKDKAEKSFKLEGLDMDKAVKEYLLRKLSKDIVDKYRINRYDLDKHVNDVNLVSDNCIFENALKVVEVRNVLVTV